ncbi:peptide ABC transporter substrate-binding protein [Oscillatoria sp. FACHB-1406]|uniref:peptide ABC transporter substrate-binding protein n=1 Tax=Oscillatoria sp. FACHB-1406 TaxID=2692846 RepID=UPI0016878C55|nr:peptide ABC transporter substrate-binding protein [Oscillatoria sp. FACHB-1406]MBD2577022.1 peptide ABC transporter substrate-binding protein [Oscillatoria sp. FACHB-1406]
MPKISLPRLSPFIFALALAACNPATTTQQTANPDTLKLLYWQAPTILNPHLSTGFKDSEASRITLEPLASFEKDGKTMIPFLAAEIPSVANGGVAKDGRSVTWKLKPNVKWSDGTPFTAADVVFTHKFVTTPAVGATTAGAYELIEKVEAIDPLTVKVTFKQPNPAWFTVFVGTEGMILPQHLYAKYAGANAREAPANLKPVGTGGYRVVEFKPGDTVVYEANPEYREANGVGFKRVELKGGGDATSAARAVLQTGDADFAYNLQLEAPVLKEFETAGRGRVVTTPNSLVERVLINHSDPNRTTVEGEKSSVQFPHPFLSDLKVRQALNLAIDRDAIATQLYGSTGKATANFLVAPPQFVSPNTRYEFNLQKAAQLLDEAGWKDTNGNGTRDRNGIEMKILFQTSVNPLRQKTQEIIKQTLQQIGIGVELKSIDASIYFSSDPANKETTEHFEADLQMFSTGNTNPDPLTYFKTYTCKEIPQKKNNWTGDNVSRYCSPEYDRLWQQMGAELNPEKRAALVIQLNDKLVSEAIVLPIIARQETVGIATTLEGFELTPWDLNTWRVAQWRRKTD